MRSIFPTAQAFNQFIDWFIPADMQADREQLKQARIFLISHIFGPFIGNTVPLALYIFDPAPGYAVAVLAMSISAFWAFPFILRRFGHYNLLAMISIENLIFCILWSCYHYGGLTSPTLPWVLTIPIISFFYISSSYTLRLSVMAMFSANLAIFSTFSWVGYNVENRLTFAAVQGLGLVSTIAASLYVTMMAMFYAKILASQSELEAQMKEHMATSGELSRAVREIERAGAAKTEFLARMSHELRTPLNAVIGYSEMLLEDAVDEGDDETADDLKRIHGSGKLLLKIVNEILDLAKIDAGKMELFPETISPGTLVRELADEMLPDAAANGNRLSVEVDEAPDTALCDKSKLRQVVAMLLDNACKFTEKGDIRLKVARDGSDAFAISVEDTGRGISPSQIPILFEQFLGEGDTSDSKYGGAGLGLALSRKITILMGGDISVQSRVGEGSTFTIRLPLALSEPDRLPLLKEAVVPPTAAAMQDMAHSRMADAHG